jgi:TonB family protein
MKSARFGLLWPAVCVATLAVVRVLAAAEDSSLRIIQTVEARFPSALAQTNITSGEATVIISVDDTGKLEDALVSSYTNKAFADEALVLLKQWRYEPARRNGARIGVRVELRVDFEGKGRIVSLTPVETMDRLFTFMRPAEVVTQVSNPRELDRHPAPVQMVMPPNPSKDLGGGGGKVTLDFYVDAEGKPRMPVVISTTHPLLAGVAAEALAQWRFTPPTREGQPVAVRVQQEFVFPATKS